MLLCLKKIKYLKSTQQPKMQDKDKKSKLEKQRLKSEANKRRAEKAKERRKEYLNDLQNCRPCRRVILLDICRAIRHHFPKLLERLSTVLTHVNARVTGEKNCC